MALRSANNEKNIKYFNHGNHHSWIKLKNCYCHCPKRRRALVQILESSNNPQRMLFYYDTCKFFEWWSPNKEE